MRQKLEQHVRLWHLLITVGITGLGGFVSAGYTWAKYDSKIQAGEEAARRIERVERILIRVADRLNIPVDDLMGE